jgi:EXLDI family protein
MYNYTYTDDLEGIDLPNKTIYVSDNDLPLFEHAQELSGANLSSAIVQALRRFIELEEAKQRGLDEITVIVNGQGAHRRKRFVGQRLVRWLQPTPKGKGTQILSVYRTAGKRYALHTRTIPNWDPAAGDPDQVTDPNNWGVGKGLLQKIMSWGYDWESFKEIGDYSLQVFETLEDLKAHVSNDLFQALSLAMEGPEIEELDI